METVSDYKPRHQKLDANGWYVIKSPTAGSGYLYRGRHRAVTV